MDELWNDYLNYLIWRGNLQKYTKFSDLFEILHNIEFTWILDRDDNREADGIELRDDYEIPDGYTEQEIYMFMNRWCSVLEMLIGLSIRVDDDFIGDPEEEHPEEFFIKMIQNLGLYIYNDSIHNYEYKKNIIRRKVNNWLSRNFASDGKGSPFPIKNDQRDQRTIEIWDQMISYINENY